MTVKAFEPSIPLCEDRRVERKYFYWIFFFLAQKTIDKIEASYVHLFILKAEPNRLIHRSQWIHTFLWDEVSGSKIFELVHIFDMVKFVRKLEFLFTIKSGPSSSLEPE